MMKNSHLCFTVYFNVFQCIVFTVGDGGFQTEWLFDSVTFEESSDGPGIFITDKCKVVQIKQHINIKLQKSKPFLIK